MNGLNELSAHEAARRIRDEEITSEALVQDCLNRIAENEKKRAGKFTTCCDQLINSS